jgi:hypothetical protein
MRRRANSPRLALLFRAAVGEPTKRIAAGSRGKVEVLGAGQQVVVHGLHPSGVALEWVKARGPDTVSLADVPAVREDQITAFLDACAPLIGATASSDASPRHRSTTLPPPGFETVPDYINAMGGSTELGVVATTPARGREHPGTRVVRRGRQQTLRDAGEISLFDLVMSRSGYDPAADLVRVVLTIDVENWLVAAVDFEVEEIAAGCCRADNAD